MQDTENNAVAQLVVLPCGLHEPRIADCLGSVTERGNKGFGSSDLQEHTARSALSAIDAGELSDPDDDVSFGRFCLFDCSALSVIPSIDEPVLVRSIDVPLSQRQKANLFALKELAYCESVNCKVSDAAVLTMLRNWFSLKIRREAMFEKQKPLGSTVRCGVRQE